MKGSRIGFARCLISLTVQGSQARRREGLEAAQFGYRVQEWTRLWALDNLISRDLGPLHCFLERCFRMHSTLSHDIDAVVVVTVALVTAWLSSTFQQYLHFISPSSPFMLSEARVSGGSGCNRAATLRQLLSISFWELGSL